MEAQETEIKPRDDDPLVQRHEHANQKDRQRRPRALPREKHDATHADEERQGERVDMSRSVLNELDGADSVQMPGSVSVTLRLKPSAPGRSDIGRKTQESE